MHIKSIIIYLALFISTGKVLSQEITGITPNQIPRGRTVETEIRGKGTDFFSEIDSSSNVYAVHLRNIENFIFYGGYKISAVNDSIITCKFDIPEDSPESVLSLHVLTYAGEIIRDDIFEVYKERKYADWKWANDIKSHSHNYGAAICSNDNFVFTTGFFYGTITIDSYTFINYNDDYYDYDCYVTKSDTLGNILWAKNIHIFDDGALYPAGILESKFKDLFIYGKICFSPEQPVQPYDQGDVFLVKIDSAGNIIFEKIFYGPEYNDISDLAIDNVGNIYITGSIYDSIFINDYKFTSNLKSNNSFLIKLNTAGEFLNGVSFGGYAKSIVYGDDSDFYLTGNFGNSITLGGIVLNDDSSNYKIPYIAKIDTSLNFIWAKEIPVKSEFASGTSSGIDLTYMDSSIYFLSSIDGAGYFDDLKIITGDGDLVVTKIDTAGNFIWGINFGSTAGMDNGKSINSADNNLYVTGLLCVAGICECSRFGDNYFPVMHNACFVASFNDKGDYQWIKLIPNNGFLNIGEGIGVIKDDVYITGRYSEQFELGEFIFESEYIQSFVACLTKNPANYYFNSVIDTQVLEIISVPFCSDFRLNNFRGLSVEIIYDTNKIVFIDSITINKEIIDSKYVKKEFTRYDSILNISVIVDSLTPPDSAINGTGEIFLIHFEQESVSFGDTIWIIPKIVKEIIADDTSFSNAKKGFIYFEGSETESIKFIQNDNEEILIYPNPAFDNIFVRINEENLADILIMGIFSLDGILLYQIPVYEKDNIISLNKLPKGIYIIRIYNDSDLFYTKLVKD